MQNEMSNFVPQEIAAKLVGRIAQDEEAPLRMNPASPLLQTAGRLKLLPIGRALENVDMGLRIACRLLALQLLRHHAVVKLRFHRNRRDDVAVHEMIDEMLGLAVFPLLRVECERLLAQRIGIALA